MDVDPEKAKHYQGIKDKWLRYNDTKKGTPTWVENFLEIQENYLKCVRETVKDWPGT